MRGSFFNSCFIPGVDRKWWTKPIMQICNKRPIIWSILKSFSFVEYLKNYKQENQKGVVTIFFNSQNFVKSHSIFVKNSMDLKRGKGIIIDICYSRLKQKKPTAIHHFQNHPVGHRLRRLVPFSWYKKCWVIWSIFF